MFSLFLIMSQVTATSTGTTPPVTFVCSGVMLITVIVTLITISVYQTTFGQHDVVLLPQLIPQDLVMGSVANCTMDPAQVSFSFGIEPPTDFLCHILVYDMALAFCFQVPMRLPCLPMGGQLLWVYNITAHQGIPLAGICASW